MDRIGLFDPSADIAEQDDEALARDMRAWLRIVIVQVDAAEYCAAQAEEDAIDRMEAEGIAAADRAIDNRRGVDL